MKLLGIKKIVLAIGIGAGCTAVGLAATAGISNQINQAKADGYTLTLNKDNVPSALTSSYQDNVQATVKTSLENDLTFNFVNAKTASNAFAQFASHGVLYNFHSSTGAVTGLNSVKVTLSAGSMSIRTAVSSEISNNGITLSDPIALTSGSAQSLAGSNYFALEAGDNGATITSIELGYTCATIDAVARLNGSYTGVMTSDNYRYKLDLSNGNATLTSIDKETNTTQSGTASLTDSTLTVTISGTTYTFTVSSDSYSLTSSAITMYRVYNVEDFESYTTDGQGWASNRGAASQYDGTGVKGNYYCDFNGSSTIQSPIGGSNWAMMASNNYLIFDSAKGHQNTKVAAFKGKDSGLRFFQLKAYYGIPSIIGKGTTFSFWARGAVNESFADSSYDATIKIFAYYNSKVTSSNQGTRTDKEFTIPAGSGWREYKMDLDSSKNYYAFAIYTKNSTASERFTPIDDVKIYTHSPYGPVSVTGVNISESERHLTIGETHQLTASVLPSDADNNQVTWSTSNANVATVSNTGLVTAVGAGSATITVTTADGGYTATCAITVTQIYPSGIYACNLSMNPSGTAYTIISIASTGEVYLDIDGGTKTLKTTSTVQSYTNNKFTIPISESFDGDSVGNITATYDATNDRLTSVGFSGRFGSNGVKNNNNLTFAHVGAWDCNEDTAGLKAIFNRSYGSEPADWTNSNDGKIIGVNGDYISNGKAMQVSGWTSGKIRLSLKNNISVSSNHIAFWVYNPSSNNVKIKVKVNTSSDLSTRVTVIQEKSLEPGWTLVHGGFTRATVYNFEILDVSYSGTSLIYDNITLL